MHAWLMVKEAGEKLKLPERLNEYKKLESGGFVTYTYLNEKYGKDHVVYCDDRYSIVHNGILLNQADLLAKYGCDDLRALIIQLYEDGIEDFFREFRGLFNGFLVDKAKASAISYQCHVGGNPLFYYNQNGLIVISPDFKLILDVLKENKITYSFNESATAMLFTYQYMLDGRTHVKEVQRLAPGSFLICGNDNLTEKRYFMFDNTNILDISEDEAVELIDESFTKAVARCLSKNAEYGIGQYLVDQSGGFDSRILNCTVKKLGYENILNVCYSQGGSRDQRASQKMAHLLKNEYIYKELDDASFFYDIDDIVGVNYGLTDYSASSGANRLLKYLDTDYFCFEHTGLIGDTITATMNPAARHMSVEEGLRMKNLPLPQDVDLTIYPNYDLFVVYTDGFYGMLSSTWVRRQYMEVTSPFLDVEFASVCLSLPMQYRYNHVVYRKWIKQKYPEAFAVISTRCANFGERLGHFIWSSAKRVQQKIAGVSTKKDGYSMTPIEYWYATNTKLKTFVTEYYQKHKHLLEPYPQTRQLAEGLFEKGPVATKMKVLTVLSVLKNFFQ